MSKPQDKFSGTGTFRPYRNNCHFCDAELVVCILVDQCVSDASICAKCVRELADYMDESKPEDINDVA